jgi:hypothetical protein
LYSNRRLKKANQRDVSFTERYQIDENIRAILLMIPMVLTHFLCFIPTLFGVPIYLKINPGAQPKDFTTISTLLNTAQFYTVLLPLLLFWRHKVLRNNLRKAMELECSILPEQPRSDGRTHEQVRHFEVLEQMWKMEENIEVHL